MTGPIGPLKGTRVLDFSRVLAGPYATRILGDLGAEVIKVQTGKTAIGSESAASSYFRAWNRNKMSITLDMNHPEAREAILKLAGLCDVVVENFSPRVMANWGLAYPKMKEARPDIIMLSMSAMGQIGPWRDYVGYAQTMQALSGITYMTSRDERSPAGPGQAYADVVSGLYGAFALLAALEYRDRTGKGQHIDLSNHEAMCSFMGPVLLDISGGGEAPTPRGNATENEPAAPCGCYPCAGHDRWCVVEVTSQAQWEVFCRILGEPAWTKDGKFATIALRKRNAEELDRRLAEWTSAREAEEIARTFQESGIPAAVVQDARDLADDPRLRSRDYFVEIEDPGYGARITDNLPMKSEARDANEWRPAPSLGRDNRYVFLHLLGFDELRFEEYVRKGIIA